MEQIQSTYIRQACIFDIDAIVPIFDEYRIFYGNPSDVALARKFFLE